MGEKDDHDQLEPPKNIPEAIPRESSRKVDLKVEAAEGSHSDGTDFGDADTDRVDYSGGGGELRVRQEVPASLSFEIKSIRSLNAKCFFCKEMECDLVFLAKSAIPDMTRAYAAHSQCVFDHERLEALGSRSL